eukprot:TRINITY_DN33195_c0_g1_i1.p1 TRINITY_DN33195_c0_g1~~TRINITY_DN33195_c0_g1_i1.p1  ORF type:complete len:230 (+),score=114.40 TRINITY_DN33195_c0_g1_i1:59-691(+)
MARRLLLVRHGQDEDNAEKLLNGHRDRPLTALGKEQAAELAANLQSLGHTIDAVIASPLQRAHNTAKAIHSQLGLESVPFEVWDDMIERDFGVLSGKPYSDIAKVAGDKVLVSDGVTYFLDVDGCETFPATLARAQRVLEKVHSQYADKTVVLVGHGDINKMVRAAFLGWSWEEGLRTAYVGNTSVIELPPPDGAAAAGAVSLLSDAKRT